VKVLSRTNKDEDRFYRPSSEKKWARKETWKKYRLECRLKLRQGKEIERFYRTEGWLTH